MPTDHIVAILIAERDRINRAIEALQGPMKPRGRLPKNPGVLATTTALPRPGRKGRSAAARKAQSARMKKYWATRRKQKST